MSNEYICPECGKELVESGKFFECIDEDNCGYRIKKEKLIIKNAHWLEKIANDEKLWQKDIFDANIPIISNEYKRLYNLCKDKQSYGMLLEIKDIFEILIKFPTLLVASIVYEKQDKTDEETKLLISMLEKALSLGDWKSLSQTAKELNVDNTLTKWLKDIVDIFDKKQITNWRNTEIGHGALSLEESKAFQKDIIKKLTIIKTFFDNNFKILRLLNDEKYHNMIDNSIFFIKDQKDYIHFFDSYYRNQKTSRIDYANGTYIKKIEEKFIQLANSFNIEKKDNLLDDCADDNIRDAQAQKIFEKLQNIDDFVEPKNITSWVNKNIKDYTKGLFLLQMQRGMGKSMFSRALDELSLNKIKLDENPLIRAYYINDIYGYKKDNFTSVVDRNILNKYLNDKKIEDRFIGKLPKSIDTESNSKDFVVLLNEYKKAYGKEKLLFIIDGLDEIPNNGEKDLTELIPNSDELEDGIYILLTSRVVIGEHIQKVLDNLTFTDTKKVMLDDKEYEQNIYSFIKQKIFSDKGVDSSVLKQIYERSEKRFVYISLIKELIKTMGLSIDDIPQANRIIQTYLDNLKAKYGDKFYKNITNLLAVITTQYEEMNLKEIAYMMGEECINFKLLAWLNDTRGLLKFERSYRGNLISIAHNDMQEYLKNNENIQGSIKQLVTNIVENITNEEYKINLENDGESYFLAYFWDYIKQLNKFIKNKFININNKILNTFLIKEKYDSLYLSRKINYFSQSINMYHIHKNEFLIYLIYINRIVCYRNIHQLDKAKKDCDYIIMNNCIDKNLLANAYKNRGDIYGIYNKKLLLKTIKDYHKAIVIFKSIYQTGQCDIRNMYYTYTNMAEAYIDAFYKYKKVNHLKKAEEKLALADKLGIERSDIMQIFIKRLKAQVYLSHNNYEMSLININNAIDLGIKNKNNNKFNKDNLISSFLLRSIIFHKTAFFDEALNDINNAIALCNELKNKNIILNKILFANLYKQKGNIYNTLGNDLLYRENFIIYFKIVIDAIYILTDLNQSKKVFFDNKKDIETVMFQNLMTEQEYIQKYYHILKYLKNEN